jgi:hypothetical protein
MRKWNRLSDMTPEHKEEVHVWGEKCGLHTAVWNDDYQEFYENDSLSDTDRVTHWHKFPEEPRKSRR